MAARHRITLSHDQRHELERVRDTSPLPYLRERAAALLRIAAGESPHRIARTGLLRPRDPDTVSRWLQRYREHGVDGLRIRPGRGRKPAFSPQPLARRSHGPDLAYRAIGTLDLLTRQVVSLGHRHRDLRTIVRLYQQVCAAYPHAERISVVHDNWPVPFHPDVLVA